MRRIDKIGESISLYRGDCLEEMKKIPDKSVDLILTDPPYNIGKAKWDKIPNYIEWCGKWLKECERLLKDNGSFYFWHNDMIQIAQLMEWIRKNTRFVFKQMIVWNKRYDGAPNKGFLDGFVEVGGLRNYQQMCEYCLYYVFQEERCPAMLDINNLSTMRKYFQGLQEFIGMNIKQINERLGHRKAEHGFYWGSTQWDLPGPETYQQLIEIFGIREWDGFRDYESLQYTFNNQKTHHSVWNYQTAPKRGHITAKPVDVLENILRHSSNEGDTILDCFMGGGSTGVACANTGRRFIGVELDENYYGIAKKQIEEAMFTQQTSLLDCI